MRHSSNSCQYAEFESKPSRRVNKTVIWEKFWHVKAELHRGIIVAVPKASQEAHGHAFDNRGEADRARLDSSPGWNSRPSDPDGNAISLQPRTGPQQSDRARCRKFLWVWLDRSGLVFCPVGVSYHGHPTGVARRRELFLLVLHEASAENFPGVLSQPRADVFGRAQDRFWWPAIA